MGRGRGLFFLHESAPFPKVTHLQFLKEIPTDPGTSFSPWSLLGALKHGSLNAALQPPELELEYRERGCLTLKDPQHFTTKSLYLPHRGQQRPLKVFTSFLENVLKYIPSRPEGN